jgi:hypothetical protein
MIISHIHDEYQQEILERANYLNYSHYGRSLGTQLNPNSDQITITGTTQWFHLLHKLGLGVDSRFIRHGNPNDGCDKQ